MNTPTQEQVEAALSWNDWNPDDPKTRPIPSKLQILEDAKLTGEVRSLTVTRILSAAYREKCEECERLKQLPPDYKN